MYFYKIGNIGFKFDTDKEFNSISTFKLFEIEENQFDNIKDKVVFKIMDKSIPKFNENKIDYNGFGYFLQKQKDKNLWFLQKAMNKPFCCHIDYKGEFHEIYIEPGFDNLIKDINDFFEIMDLVSIFVRFNTLILHSSFINYKNKGIIFSGPSEIGKSTQANLWNRYENTDIVNGDRSLIKIENDKCIAYGFPYSGSSLNCLNQEHEIKLIVILEQGDKNQLIKLKSLEKFKYIYSQIGINKWDKELSVQIIDLVEKLINDVCIIKFSCLPNEDAVKVLKEFIEKEDLI